jgi:hypothetical protein
LAPHLTTLALQTRRKTRQGALKVKPGASNHQTPKLDANRRRTTTGGRGNLRNGRKLATNERGYQFEAERREQDDYYNWVMKNMRKRSYYALEKKGKKYDWGCC